jgi:transcription antitermination factor NusG
MNTQLGWYLIYVTAGTDAKAREAIEAEGLPVFMPEYRAIVRHARKLDIVRRSLFPRYMFALLNPARGDRATIKNCRDVELVTLGESARPVPEKVVWELSFQCLQRAFDHVPRGVGRKPEDYPQDCPVRVLDERFGEMIGKIKAQPHGGRALVLCEWLGREMQLSVPIDRLEAV